MHQTRYCRRHPRAKAGWHCATCQADLCPDCVASQVVGHRHAPMDICCQCRRGVPQLTIHRAELVPFWQRVLDAPKYPLGSVGLISLVGFGFVRALTSQVGLSSMMMMGAGVFLLRHGLFWAFLFFIIKNSAEGATRMGVLGLRDIQSDVIAPALKGIVATALVWLPAAIYIIAVSEGGLLGILAYEGHKDPVVWLLGAIGILYAPMALLAGATDLGFGYILNPVQIFAFIRRTGRDYFVAVAGVAVVLAFGRIVDHLVGGALARVGIPFLPRWLAETISLYPSFVAARILGVLLFTRGEVLDWGRTEDYQVPVLPGVRARGTVEQKPAARSPAKPSELSSEVAPVAPAPGPAVPFFDPQVAPFPGAEAQPDAVAPGLAPVFAGRPGPPALAIALDAEAPGPAALTSAAQAAGVGSPAMVAPDLDFPGLPPLDRSAPVLEAQAFIGSDEHLAPVDLPAELPPPPGHAAPQPASFPTVRGFSSLTAPTPAERPSPPRLDLGVTRVGHAGPLSESGAPALQTPQQASAIAPLLHAVEQGRMDEALRIYRDLPGQDAAIPPPVHVKLGKEASRVRDFDVAAHAFKQVAFSTHALAGAALVSLAQVVGDGQRDKAAAEKLYREALARFPGSDVATFAERKLAAAKA